MAWRGADDTTARAAVFGDRARLAARCSSETDGRTQNHERVMPAVGASRGYELLVERDRLAFAGDPAKQHTAEHATDVRIGKGHAFATTEAADGAGRVRADAGQEIEPLARR